METLNFVSVKNKQPGVVKTPSNEPLTEEQKLKAAQLF